MIVPFDEIYCLHLVEDYERYELLKNELERVGLNDKTTIYYTCKKNINTILGDYIESLHDSYYDEFKIFKPSVYGNVFDCSYNHYSIIKQSYLRGLNSILIIEDDIKFNDDLNLINTIFNNIPKDYDVIKFYNTNINYDNNLSNNELFCCKDNNNLDMFKFSTLCYALSKKGMELVIDEYEKNFLAADIALDNVRFKTDKFYYLIKNNLCSPNNTKSNIVW